MTSLRYDRHEETLALMRRAPVIPVLTVTSRADGLAQARALVAGGLPVIEVTLRTPAALPAIRAIADEVPGAVVGAGTILDETGMAAALAAGARFLVSPGATRHLAEAAAASPVPFLPGAATASEVMALREVGFRQMKFFPAETSGGAKALAALAGPLGDVVFCPTGGIDLAKAPTYLALPNVACVGGSWMTPKAALAAGDYAAVEALAREAAALARPA
ncbi:MAG: bifunctional 4-hydroxy-2-oxoglutarate aldolase/2-dehydro-3-deoxy-phosphogluconate aldolase [Rhizobiales bacterium]|nr:bifunctional 4-hydroxy-2-oxoglutarate aldolase/2-dehydro-3-deoxy-phosphogluconate aldolase [Hyphomicrobiales bacterium]